MPAQTSSAPAASPSASVPENGREQRSAPAWLGIGYRHWLWLVCALGIAVRVEQYLFDRSLWLDESMVVLNLLHRSFAGLTRPLNPRQFAPMFWLFAEKACNILFGSGELAFRLVAITSGVVAMVLVVLLARRLLMPLAALVAVALFAFSRPLIYYSSEVKPYGSDAAACALLWLLGFWALRGRSSASKLAVLATVGVFLFWFSFPLLFVAGGLGAAVLFASLEDRNWRRLATFAPVFLAWTASFATYYWLFLRTTSDNPTLAHSYPFFTSPIHFATIDMALQNVFTLEQNPPTLLLGVALFAAIIGGVHFWRENRVAFCFLVLPLFFALAASNRYLYPLLGRLYLFYTPALFILVGAGAGEICLAARSRVVPIAATLLVLLFIQPVVSTFNIVQHHMPGEELRPVLQYVQRHQRPGDTWYVYYYARYAYEYYAEAYGLSGSNVALGSGFRVPPPRSKNWDVYQEDFSKLRGRRVWVIFSHNWTLDGVDEPAYALHVLDSMGVRKDIYLDYGAAAYLYDLSPAPAAAPGRSAEVGPAERK